MRILGIGRESGPFFFPAFLAYKKHTAIIEFIIDTGADMSLLSHVDAVRAGIDFSKLKKKSMVAGIGGISQIRLLKDVVLTFQTNDREKPLYVVRLPQIAVSSESRIPIPSLLGIDFIRNFSLHFDAKHKLMYLETEEVSREAMTTKAFLARLDEQEFAVLHSYMSYPNDFVRELCLFIDNKLPAFFPRGSPQEEKQVEDEVEKLLMARDYRYTRQDVSFEFSGKAYKPDIIFQPEKTVLEIKLCKSQRRASQIIDEIGSDIVAYETKFEHLIFIVYDLGFIKNPFKFKNDIENRHPNTILLIVKD